MNQAIETYLKKATRGLWGRKKQAIKEELMAHINGRVNAHLIAGLNEQTAVQKALNELGQPRHISAGMMRLHTAPTLMMFAMVVSFIALTVFALLTGGMAQSLPGTFYWPSEQCISAIQDGKVSGDVLQDYLNKRLDENCFVADNSLYLDYNALKSVLKTEGVEIRGAKILFPDGDYILFTPTAQRTFVTDDEDKPIIPEPQYFDLWHLVEAVAQNPSIPLGISGWDNPTVHMGEASFQIGTDEQPFKGADFYDHYLERVLFRLTSQIPGDYVDVVNPRVERLAKGREFYGNDWHEDLVNKINVQVDTQNKSGIYGVIVMLDLENPLVHQPADYGETHELGTSFHMALARADADGSVTLELPGNETVEFVNTFGSSPTPGEAVLVELAADADSWFRVIPPEQIGLE